MKREYLITPSWRLVLTALGTVAWLPLGVGLMLLGSPADLTAFLAAICYLVHSLFWLGQYGEQIID